MGAEAFVVAQIVDFAEATDDRVASLLVAGSGISIAYNDGAGTLTIASTVSASFASLSGSPSDNAALAGALDGKSNTGHTHVISDITSLQTILDGKAALSHTHTIANVTGLQAALDAKAATSHTHVIADTTGLQAALDAKLNLSGGTLTGALAGVSIGLVAAIDTPLSVTSSSTNVTTFGVVNSSSGMGWAFQVGGSIPSTGAPAGSFTFRQTLNDLNTGIIASDGRWLIGAGVPLASTQLAVVSRAAGNAAGVFRGAASQTANLTEWQNSSATVLASVSSSGSITTAGDCTVHGHIAPGNGTTGTRFSDGFNADRIRILSTFSSISGGFNQLRLANDQNISWAANIATNSADIRLNRAAAGQLNLLGNLGLRIRNLADSSDGPLTASTGNFSGQVNANNLMLNNFQWIGWGGLNYIAADTNGVRLNFVPLNQITTLSCVTANISGLLSVGTYTVATLPSAAANPGRLAQVTDSSVTANGAAVAGGGSTRVLVFSNGSTWDVVVA